MFSVIKKSQDNWTKNKQKIKKHNQIIKPYESTVAFENFLRKNRLLSKQTNHIVDIGTGIGSHLDYLSKKNNHIEFTGIDYSSRLIEEAKKLKRQNNINFLKINILKKNKNKSISNCDGVICIQTFCCFKNAEDPIKFICNLKPKWIAINSLFYDGPLDIQIHIKDYEDAISENTKMLLWVHTSNYVMSGYTKEVSLEDMVLLGKKYNIPVVADLGSGSFLDMSNFGVPTELPVSDIVKKGPDITLFSGDKMLGGPQSGIILSTNKLIEVIKSNSIYRTVRCDKITIALLDDIIRSFKKKGFLKSNLALRLLTKSRKDLKLIAEEIIQNIPSKIAISLGLIVENSMVEAGSGSLPEKNIESIALKFKPKNISVNHLAASFKRYSIPIIGYINKESFYIDLKAILPSQVPHIINAIKTL